MEQAVADYVNSRRAILARRHSYVHGQKFVNKTTQVRVVVCHDKTGGEVVTQNEWFMTTLPHVPCGSGGHTTSVVTLLPVESDNATSTTEVLFVKQAV